jgi:glycosyltransferase involved in cell wall biosynthesis
MTGSGSRRWIVPLAERFTMPDLTAKPTVSIVVLFHNEEDNITELYARLRSVMEDVDWEYQFVFVDDGSTDLTYKRLRNLAVIDPRVAVIQLRRNFGQAAALAAGFAHCKCDYVIAMDVDLQHDPAEIPRFLEKLEEGYDVVSGWRKHPVNNLLLVDWTRSGIQTQVPRQWRRAVDVSRQ